VATESANIGSVSPESRIPQIFRRIPVDCLARRRRPGRFLHSRPQGRGYELFKREAMRRGHIGQFGADAIMAQVGLPRCSLLQARFLNRRLSLPVSMISQ
jgi:hypothetical protein